MIGAAYSLRRRLLLLLLLPVIAIGVLALLDTWRDALATANAVSDRVLAGSALAIAERVVVSEDGVLEVDVPYVALEMLTSAAQDRVFYRIDGPPGTFITCCCGSSTWVKARPKASALTKLGAPMAVEAGRMPICGPIVMPPHGIAAGPHRWL